MVALRYVYLVLLVVVAVACFHIKGVNGREGAPLSSAYFHPPALATRGGSDSHPSLFLPTEYDIKGVSSVKFKVRQVPGDGGCLFHTLAVSIAFVRDKQHPECFDSQLRKMSNRLRLLSIDVLRKGGQCLCMEGPETMMSHDLLDMVASGQNTTPKGYLANMTISKSWGGGPEIVAISNHFKRPIHVYELDTTGGPFNKRFILRICATFGSPAFADKCPLYVLSADGRFPHIGPGTQKELGDHFLALFPVHATGDGSSARAVRGGSISGSDSGRGSSGNSDAGQTTYEVDGEAAGEGAGSGRSRLRGVTRWLGSLPPLRGIAGMVSSIRGSDAVSFRGSAGMQPEEGGSGSVAAAIARVAWTDSEDKVARAAEAEAALLATLHSLYPSDTGEFDGL